MWCEKFDIEKQLGRGQFGVVVQCVEKRTGERVAIKVIKKKGRERDGTVSWEVEALQLAQGHRRLLQLLDVFETSTDLALVLELVQGGELFDYLAKNDTFTEEEAVLFTRQLLDGLDYLHRRKVAHLDIKPENIVLVEEGCVGAIKIIDFGLARILNTDEPQFVSCGTPEFVAPEIVRHRPVTTAADMWAVGVTTYILLSGMSPFMGETNKETFRNVAMICYNLDEDFSGTEMPTEALDFIQSLLIEDPSQRLTAKECQTHLWIGAPVERRRSSVISTELLRKFNAKRKWHSTVQAVQAYSFMRSLSVKSKQQLPYRDWELQAAEMEQSGGSSEFSETETDMAWSVRASDEHNAWYQCHNIPLDSKISSLGGLLHDKLQEKFISSLKLTGCLVETHCTSTQYSATASSGRNGRLCSSSDNSETDTRSPQTLEEHFSGSHNSVGRLSALQDQTPGSHLGTHSKLLLEQYQHTDMLKTRREPYSQEEPPYHMHTHAHAHATVSAERSFEG